MSLQPVGVAAAPDVKQISLISNVANAILYTVPAGRMFTGLFTATATTVATVNNVSLPNYINNVLREIDLGPGAVVRNGGASGVILHGIERDAI